MRRGCEGRHQRISTSVMTSTTSSTGTSRETRTRRRRPRRPPAGSRADRSSLRAEGRAERAGSARAADDRKVELGRQVGKLDQPRELAGPHRTRSVGVGQHRRRATPPALAIEALSDVHHPLRKRVGADVGARRRDQRRAQALQIRKRPLTRARGSTHTPPKPRRPRLRKPSHGPKRDTRAPAPPCAPRPSAAA